MKKLNFFFFFVFMISFCFSNELTKKQKREYRKKRIFIESYESTKGRLSQWSISSTTITKWRPRINNTIIRESTFYQLTKEENYYKKARFNENLFFWSAIAGITSTVIGAGFFISGYLDYKTKTDKYFNDLPEEFSLEDIRKVSKPNYDLSSTLMTVGASGLIIGGISLIPALYIFFFVDKQIDIQTANELAEEYNQELQVGILKKF